MSFPLLATRLLARQVVASSKLVFRHAPTAQITRNFSVSSVAWARAAATTKAKAKPKPKTKGKAKPATKKTPAKRPQTKSVRKPAARKTKATKKAAPKARKARVAKKATVKKVVLRGKPELKPPKQPGGPYVMFFRKYFADLPRQEGVYSLDIGKNAARQASAMWNALSEQEKQPFRDADKAAFAEYWKRLEEYRKNTDIAVIKEINKRREKMGKRKIPMTRKHSYNGYIMFSLEQRVNKPRPESLVENQALTKEIANEWMVLSDEEKSSYKQKAQERNEALKRQ